MQLRRRDGADMTEILDNNELGMCPGKGRFSQPVQTALPVQGGSDLSVNLSAGQVCAIDERIHH